MRRFICEYWTVLAAAAFVVLCFWIADQEEQEWQAYAAAHHCRAVGTRKGQATTTWSTDSNGNMQPGVAIQSDQTIYACDSGEMQIR